MRRVPTSSQSLPRAAYRRSTTGRTSTRSSWAPASPACTPCTGCGSSGLRVRVFERGRRGRRNLVLEPLSRRALRHREPSTTRTPSPTSSSRNGSGPSAIRPQPEILRYLNHVADRFDLRRDIQLTTRVTRGRLRGIEWPLAGHDRGRGSGLGEILRDGVRVPVVARTARAFAGLDAFAGDWYHTGALAP